ncbi:endonuclease/exonuclease/phosphatase family protein [Marinoscillum sp.]|uniref:endonuclease/exonuclease/phosphatase family protein n=1 Tax=Marinoscillum sp. TaxID=2024838 RepID=UPI003BAC4877
MKRIFIYLPIILLVAFIGFFFWGSAGSLDSDQLDSKIVYHPNYKKSKDTLRVMTFNLGYLSGMTNNLPIDRDEQLFEDNLQKTQSLLNTYSPDVIGFQEIDFAADRSFGYNQLDSLAQGYATAYRSVNWDKTYVPFPYWPFSRHFGRMLSGQAILSKYELTEIETITLEKPLNASFLYNRFYLDRLIQIVKLRLDSTEVILMNVHLEAFDKETRLLHGKVVVDLFEKYADRYPVLIIGDFNSEPDYLDDSDVMEMILSANGIASAISQENYEAKSTTTFPSSEPSKMIDYLLYNPKYLQVVESNVIQEAGEISDHLPVLSKFVLR